MSSKAKKKGKTKESSNDSSNDSSVVDVSVSSRLLKLYSDAKFTDITFDVDGTIIKAHRFVLAARSEYFKALLYSGFAEGGESTIKVPNADPTLFEVMIRQCYGDSDSGLDESNLRAALQLADMYQVRALAECAVKYMKQNLESDNVFTMLEMVPVWMNCDDVVMKYLRKKAGKAFKTQDILSLSPFRLEGVLTDSKLAVEEQVVFEAAMRWAEFRASKQEEVKSENEGAAKRRALGKSLYQIRFPVLPMETIATEVAPTKVLTEDELLELYRWKCLKGDDFDVSVPLDASANDVNRAWETEQKEAALPFVIRPREPEACNKKISWSLTHKHPSLTLSEKNTLATCSGSNRTAASDLVFSKGIVRYDLVLEGSTGAYMMCGCIPANYSNFSGGSHVGDSTFRGWGLFTYSSWSRYRNNSSQNLTGGSGQGPCTVGVVLDFSKGSVDFYRGGYKKGTRLAYNGNSAFTDLQGPVRPAVTLYSGNVRIQNLSMGRGAGGGDDDEEESDSESE